MCRADGCEKTTKARGYCAMHLGRLYRMGALEYALPEDDGHEWRAVRGYEGIYEVSDDGRVRRAGFGQRTARGRELRPRVNRHGYLQLTLSANDQRKTRGVHALVAEAFHGARPDGLFACHNNGVKTDNRAENLRWASNAENQRDSVAHGTHPLARKTHCKRGHEFTDENTYSRVRADGRSHRRCRTCMLMTDKARRAASRVEVSA